MKTALYRFGARFKPLHGIPTENEKVFGCTKAQTFINNYSVFGFDKDILSVFDSPSEGMRTALTVTADATACRITLIDTADILENRNAVYFFLNECAFLIVSDIHAPSKEAQTDELFENAFRETVSADYSDSGFSMAVYHFFEGLIVRDPEMIEAYENDIAEFESLIEKNNVDIRFNARLLRMRKKLFILRNYYEQLYEIGSRLTENVNGIITKEETACLSSFANHVKRLSENVLLLRDTLVQVRQEYNSVMDYNLNKTMKFHTVLTTVFLPLNLLVGWYGMNFKMPEFEHVVSYPIFAGFSAAVAAGVIIVLKKKKLF